MKNSNFLAILKSTSIFKEIPEGGLVDILPYLEEKEIGAGRLIFAKGEMGRSLYIILDGLVRVHDGERTLNYLSQGDVFGEMAALDPEPRSASVTAVQSSHLLQLDRQPLFELMSKHITANQQVIHILCHQLRARVSDMAEDYQYMQQFSRLTSAAVALENGVYDANSLDEVAERPDELGQLGRVFQRMVREVYPREQRLKQQVAELRIEIDQRRQDQQVAEITETEYFQQLSSKLDDLRQRRRGIE